MACSRRGSSRKQSPPIGGHTWQHVSIPKVVDTCSTEPKIPVNPLEYSTAEPLSDSLWSGEWKLFADTNSSDWPSQSVASSTSWSDELESESTRKLYEQFEQIECSLYSDCNQPELANCNLAIECQQWKERFPHLRIVGEKLGLISSNGAASITQVDLRQSIVECENQSEDAVNVEKDVDGKCSEELFVEESEDGGGDEEEVFAVDGCFIEHQASSISPVRADDVDSKLVPVDDLPDFKLKVKKAVSDKIFSIVWPDVVKKIEPVFKKLLERNPATIKSQIPALSISAQAESSSCSSSDVGFDSSIDNFLQVSPKPMSLSVRESSGRKSRMRTISHITANLLDYSNDFHHNHSTARNASAAAAVGARSSAVKLVFPAAAEKLLSPIAHAHSHGHAQDKGRRTSANIASASNRSRQLLHPFQQNYDEQQARDRFCSRPDTSRNDAKTGRKASPLSNWTRHGVLPPIAFKENSLKVSSAFSKRSASALQQNETSDLDVRPNTSLPNKNVHCLQPLDKLEAKENLAVRMELAHQWLQNQISPNNYGKNQNMSLKDNTNTGWRSKMNGIYWK